MIRTVPFTHDPTLTGAAPYSAQVMVAPSYVRGPSVRAAVLPAPAAPARPRPDGSRKAALPPSASPGWWGPPTGSLPGTPASSGLYSTTQGPLSPYGVLPRG
jgi:hypothetical protein